MEIRYLLYFLVVGVFFCGALAIDRRTDELLKTFEQSNFTDVFASTNRTVYHMEEDLYKPSFILYNGGYAIKTTDGSTPEIVAGHTEYSGYREGVAGDARFSNPSRFAQISADKLVVTDSTVHCLRLVDRITGVTSPFVGLCKQGGTGEGVGTSARFYYPSAVMVDKKNPNQLYVLDNGNQGIKTVDISTKQVRYLVRDRWEDNLKSMQGMTQDNETGDVLVSNKNFIYRIGRSRSLSRISGSKTYSGLVDGRMSLGRFNSPRDMIQVGRLLFLVADTGNRKVRLLDFDANDVTTRKICAATPKSANETAANLKSANETEVCEIPYSLLVTNNQLLIGTTRGILRGGIGSSKTTSKVTGMQGITTPQGSLTTKSKSGASTPKLGGDKGSGTVVIAKCPTDLKVSTSPTTDLATFVFTVSGLKHTVVMPEGRYPYTIEVANRKCQFNLIAEDYRKQNVRQSLTFEALYDVDCKIINDSNSLSLLKTIGKLRYTVIEDLCKSDCGRPTPDAEPIMQCDAKNKLVIKWQTNKLYELDAMRIPASLQSELERRVAIKGPILDITVFGRNPPIVYPYKNTDGGYAGLKLSPTCINGTRLANSPVRCV